MKKILVSLLIVMSFGLLVGCSGSGYTNISNDELKTMLADGNYQFVDVRTSEEFYDEKIPGFLLNIDYYQLEDDYSMLDKLDKDTPVVIMCNSGNRSVSASEIFVKEGFVEVYNLTNGIQGWDGETE